MNTMMNHTTWLIDIFMIDFFGIKILPIIMILMYIKYCYIKKINKYVIRYNDVNKMNVVPLQFKMNNCNDIIHEIKYSNTLILIKSNNKELFRKIREIWNKIIELIGTNNANDFVRNTEYGDKYITTNVHENTNFLESNYRDELVIVLHFVVGICLETSLVQVRTHKCL